MGADFGMQNLNNYQLRIFGEKVSPIKLYRERFCDAALTTYNIETKFFHPPSCHWLSFNFSVCLNFSH